MTAAVAVAMSLVSCNGDKDPLSMENLRKTSEQLKQEQQKIELVDTIAMQNRRLHSGYFNYSILPNGSTETYDPCKKPCKSCDSAATATSASPSVNQIVIINENNITVNTGGGNRRKGSHTKKEEPAQQPSVPKKPKEENGTASVQDQYVLWAMKDGKLILDSFGNKIEIHHEKTAEALDEWTKKHFPAKKAALLGSKSITAEDTLNITY
ncbi:MAG: hypothetical protein WCO35_03735 [Candidatus Nomurabacteria bacterium]